MKFNNPFLVIFIGSIAGTFNTLVLHRIINSLNNDNK